MRVLWITNIPILKHRQMLHLGTQTSGGWMEASYNALKGTPDIVIGVVTSFFSKNLKKEYDGNNPFYILPFTKDLSKYNPDDSENQKAWEHIIDDFKPDVIQLWGTEFSHGLCALKVAKDIPSVVYIQGMVSQISRHYLDGLSFSEIIACHSIGDLITHTGILKENKRFKKRADIEKQILRLSKNAIIESRWCANCCRAIEPECDIFESKISINPSFANYHWNIDCIEQHSIFSVAGGYPIKSHHTLFKIVASIKWKYPDVKLYVPGSDYHNIKSKKDRLFQKGYNRYCSKLIKKLDIENNVVFTGSLSPDQMASYMQKCNVFVMPSSCENHSTTMIEAMIVGIPCVSTIVGGVQGYAMDGNNCLLSRFGEFDVMAQDIMRILEDKQLAVALSQNGSVSSRSERLSIDLKKDFIENIVAQDALSLLTDERIEEIATIALNANRVDVESTTDLVALKGRLHETQVSLNNLLKAIESGLAPDTLVKRMAELEKEKKVIEEEMRKEESSVVFLDKEQIIYWLEQFKEGSLEDDDFKRTLIDLFVNSVTVWDDDPDGFYKISIAYNLTSLKTKTYRLNKDGRSESDIELTAPDWKTKENCFISRQLQIRSCNFRTKRLIIHLYTAS